MAARGAHCDRAQEAQNPCAGCLAMGSACHRMADAEPPSHISVASPPLSRSSCGGHSSFQAEGREFDSRRAHGGECRPVPAFPFVEPDARLASGIAFRGLPGDSEAFRGIVVTFWSHPRRQLVALRRFGRVGAATALRLRQSWMPPRRRPEPRCGVSRPRLIALSVNETKPALRAAKASSEHGRRVSRRERLPPRLVCTTVA